MKNQILDRLGGVCLGHRLGRPKAALTDWLEREIRQIRTGESSHSAGLLAELALTSDPEGMRLRVRDIVDQLVTLIVAGYETTAHALCWAILDIYSRPNTLDEIRNELELHTKSHTSSTNNPMLHQYLRATISESMRLCPVIPVSSRMLARPCTLAGREFPEGTIIWAVAPLVHRKPELWPEPEIFRPERFIGTRPAAHHYFPWGGGLRRCIGANIALGEVTAVLAHILRLFDIRAPTRPKPHFHGFSISPGSNFIVECRARSASSKS